MAFGGYQRGAFGAPQSRKRFNEMLLGNLKRMDEGTLGLSESEKSRMAEGAQQAAATQAAAQTADVQRAAMAGGQSPFAGQAAQLQRDIGEQAQNAAAMARVGADELSSNLAAARRSEVEAMMERQRERQRQESKEGFKAASGAVAAMLGGGGGEALTEFLKKAAGGG